MGEHTKEKLDARQRQRLEARNIASHIIPPKSERRRKRAEKDLHRFCLSYMKHIFEFEFSPVHEEVIRALQDSILDRQIWPALILPRGFGKTSLATAAILWALLYGHSKFCIVVGANKDRAEDLLRAVRTELEANETLVEDFPHALVPIQEVRGSKQRLLQQNIDGVLTQMRLSADEIIMPWVLDQKKNKPFPFANSTIRAIGAGTSIRGAVHTLANGKRVRPDLIFLDDISTDQDARSPTMTQGIINYVRQTLTGLAAPGASLSIISASTVIYPGDFSTQLLARTAHPAFSPVRYSLLTNLPSEENAAFQIYKNMRLSGAPRQELNQYYLEHREEIENGVSCIWESFKRKHDVSATQTALNLYIDSPSSFLCEYQNDPQALRLYLNKCEELSFDDLENCVSPIERGVPIEEHEHIAAHIDVHEKLLYYVVASVGQQSLHILDYNVFPDQMGFQIDHKKPKVSLTTTYGGVPGGPPNAVSDLLKMLREKTDYGRPISWVSVDVAWGAVASLLRQILSSREHYNFAVAATGIARGVTQTQIDEWRTKPGEITGPGFRYGKWVHGYGYRFLYDTNFYKSQIVQMIKNRSLSIFSGNHELLFRHLLSERPVKKAGENKEIVVFEQLPDQDNHFFDCIAAIYAVSRMKFPYERSRRINPTRPDKIQNPHLTERKQETIISSDKQPEVHDAPQGPKRRSRIRYLGF